MNATRREALMSALFGAGWIGLRSLATGLPIALLANPRRADANILNCEPNDAQFIILSTSASGDPMNGNVPGTYDHPDVMHSLDPAMEKTEYTVHGRTFTGARLWATMPQDILERTVFFHHTTLTNSHANQSKVMKLMGAVKRQEMLVSLLAKHLAPCLGTVQKEPAVLGAAGPGEFLSYEGRTLPALSPVGLRDLLLSPAGPLTRLQQLRDASLNKLAALYKESGTPAQRAFLDRMVRSQSEVRAISQDLLNRLSTITNNGIDAQINAAITMIQMKVAPVMSIRLTWGGDNHSDMDLRGEVAQHTTSINAIVSMQRKLAEAGLQDKVSFMAINVFGRTMHINHKGRTGRDHLGNHHCTVMIGKRFKGGVIGGVRLLGRDFAASPIDSKSGVGTMDGDVAFNDTLGAMGKTFGAAVGVSDKIMNDWITAGKAITAALV